MHDRVERNLRCLSIAAISAGCILFAGTAYAQSAEAESLFSEGNQLMKAGKLDQACDAFEASNRIEARAGTLIRLGECREQNHQLASAWSAYKDALTRVKDPRKKALATGRVTALEPKLSYLTISVADTSRMDGLTITRNGHALDIALWNRGAPVDGGDYVVAGRAPGHEEWKTTVTVPADSGKINVDVPRLKEIPRPVVSTRPSPAPATAPTRAGTAATPARPGATAAPVATRPGTAVQPSTQRPAPAPTTARVTQPRPAENVPPWAVVTPTPASPAPAPAPAPVTEPGAPPSPTSMWTGKRKLAIGLGVGSVVGVVAGSVFGSMAGSSNDEAHRLCPSAQMPCTNADAANKKLDDRSSLALDANIAFGISAVMAIGAGVLWFTGAPETQGPHVAVAPRLAPGEAGVFAFGTF